jgi:hypothetical protein
MDEKTLTAEPREDDELTEDLEPEEMEEAEPEEPAAPLTTREKLLMAISDYLEQNHLTTEYETLQGRMDSVTAYFAVFPPSPPFQDKDERGKPVLWARLQEDGTVFVEETEYTNLLMQRHEPEIVQEPEEVEIVVLQDPQVRRTRAFMGVVLLVIVCFLVWYFLR